MEQQEHLLQKMRECKEKEMKLQAEQLTQLTELAECQMTPHECIIVLNIDKSEFMEDFKNPKSDIYKSYEKGRLKSIVEVRKSVLKLAIQGSSPAQKQMIDIMDIVSRRVLSIK